MATNGNAGGRIGSISIGNRTFSITQEGQSGPAPPPTPNCTYSLSANSQTDPGTKNYIHIEASAADPDGQADVAGITLVLTDGKGRELNRWTMADFSPNADGLTWELEQSYKVSGRDPWTLTLTVVDASGATASASVLITR